MATITACIGFPRRFAPKHGTSYAYKRYSCRCPDAIADRKREKDEWLTTPVGQAYTARHNERRRAARRDADGLVWHDRWAAKRADGLELLARGETQTTVAQKMGVCVRTIQRWVRWQRKQGTP